MTVVMDGKKVAAHLSDEIREALEVSESHGIQPKVAFVRIGDLSDSISYENAAVKRFEKLGIQTSQFHFPEDVSTKVFLTKFREINEDYSIHGILLLQPLPKHIPMKRVAEVMNSFKDIDGMKASNLGKVLTNDPDRLEPCTPAAVMNMLDYYDIDLKGKNVTVVGASAVVGKPLSLLMMNREATVTTCNLYTDDLVEKCKNADVIVSAAGAINLIDEPHVKEGAVVVDVGINFNDEGKMVGDVNYEAVKDKASFITPVPGGIGAITTTVLAYHLVKATEHQKEPVLFLEKQEN
ncbi:bifunctional 5,10-methylenetetrahydrofolate dehydrogenase/5,10-methenyltetrahydrofolate cyclohydrolase [Jeotgalicoccus huakuii]|uniref:bifunctional 5,10-methylenetetrahydrofolate dehydrogenase/5,10-methenyltetrahydrofolate cyclohydrolase n=1 Tax=Jeotgalicoccus TaxID=227979 RepID=UPI000410E960|nr:MULTISPECIES: bifunctional 5,10-methylenetetrahydrofolate dehydrogenase/5,10-methenyltetrahydrofolate cyclohydrolase [Jeotgalicoccus]MCK1976851.1 bifunctional 5,10-methylenetetrahydrofolate dehydrogenase/5,10-methenyltetrahydrofolate cyclohydrolase [Jeotgalicoccus huakuii]QQD85023.1 bifunctional 5,10-methylenetetrahydrofolate dehydrogenase/5,10-methenyltetrahydrofolate cyclohydrolase [Jeotgalicoccus sp. ATCC 8456]